MNSLSDLLRFSQSLGHMRSHYAATFARKMRRIGKMYRIARDDISPVEERCSGIPRDSFQRRVIRITRLQQPRHRHVRHVEQQRRDGFDLLPGILRRSQPIVIGKDNGQGVAVVDSRDQMCHPLFEFVRYFGGFEVELVDIPESGALPSDDQRVFLDLRPEE